MKICFVCGFLEPGKSGVGDYAILLAKKLVELGHECSMLAIHDSFVKSPLETSITTHSINILRLPKEWSWDERTRKAREFIEEKNPDVLSLQYVCYAYAKRGLAFNLGKVLRQISGCIPWHVMVHEIWLGEKKGAGIKDIAMGTLQKLLAKDMFLQISPRWVHTSNETYRGCLLRAGIKSRVLPMYCTVPVQGSVDIMKFLAKLKDRGAVMSRRDRCEHILFGMFGILFANWPPEPLLSRLHSFCEKQGKRGAIISMGGMGGGVDLWRKMSEQYRQSFLFVELGRVEESEISNLLLNMDYGIAATPLELLGKSTSAAAFLEHGIPLIANREEPYGLESDGKRIDEWIISLDQDFESNLLSKKKRAPEARVDQVARQFVKDLQIS